MFANSLQIRDLAGRVPPLSTRGTVSKWLKCIVWKRQYSFPIGPLPLDSSHYVTAQHALPDVPDCKPSPPSRLRSVPKQA
jgi:hypothetical protein